MTKYKSIVLLILICTTLILAFSYAESSDNKLEKKYYRQDGTLEKIERYDIYGHQVEESYYGGDGKLCRNPLENWATIRRGYEDGKLAEESTYDVDGCLIERKIFNKLGDLVKRQYVGDANPSEEFSPPLALSGRTDEFFDPSGKEKYETSATIDPLGIWE